MNRRNIYRALIPFLLTVSSFVILLSGCGAKNNEVLSSNDNSGSIADYVGTYNLIYKEGSSISEEGIRTLKSVGKNLSLTINEEGTAIFRSIEEDVELVFNVSEMTLSNSSEEMKVSFENGILNLDEVGKLLFFEKQVIDGAASPAEDPDLLNRGDDATKRQIFGIDDDLTLYAALGINEIVLTEGGRLTAVTYGDLQANEGSEVTLATDAETFDILDYGNGGYRAIVFVRKDGTVSAVAPSPLIEEQRIENIDNIGELTRITTIYQVSDESGSRIAVVDEEGDETIIDEYLY